MFGLACKGLHCAGCGKGIPLGIVILLVAAVSRVSNVMVQALANAVMVAGFVVGGCIIATGAIVALIQRRDFQMDYSRWDGLTYVQQKEAAEWPNRGALTGRVFAANEGETKEMVQVWPE